MLLLSAPSNMLVSNASPRGPMCFRRLVFSLSGPCELLFLLCFICSWAYVISLYFYVTMLVDLFVLLCVACLSVCECLVKQFAIFLGVVVILLLNFILWQCSM